MGLRLLLSVSSDAEAAGSVTVGSRQWAVGREQWAAGSGNGKKALAVRGKSKFLVYNS